MTAVETTIPTIHTPKFSLGRLLAAAAIAGAGAFTVGTQLLDADEASPAGVEAPSIGAHLDAYTAAAQRATTTANPTLGNHLDAYTAAAQRAEAG